MNVSREDKKTEAVERMKLLHLFPETIRQFEQEDYVSLSEPPVGAFFWIDDKGLSAVRKFEDEYNALVYVGVRAYTTIGVMDAFLYVSDHKEEGCADRIDLQNRSLWPMWSTGLPLTALKLALLVSNLPLPLAYSEYGNCHTIKGDC